MAVKIYTSGNQFIMEFDGRPEPVEGAKANVNVQLVDDATKTFLMKMRWVVRSLGSEM